MENCIYEKEKRKGKSEQETSEQGQFRKRQVKKK